MEELKSNPEQTPVDNVEIILPEAVVEIQMSTGYYKKIQQLLAFIVETRSPEDIKDAHDQISSQEIVHDWVHHYETLLILCREFEQKAKDQGFTKVVSLDEAAELLKED